MTDDQGAAPVEEVSLEPTTVVRSKRPRALWGILGVAVLAAGALVIRSGDDDSMGAARRLPVAMGSSAERAESDAAAGAASDAMFAWISYRAGDDLPAMGGTARAYRVSGGVTEAEVRALMGALGIDGEPTHQDGFWQASSADGHYVEVFEGAGGQWWYSADIDFGGNAGGGVSGSTGAGACPPDADCQDTVIAEEPALECEPGTSCTGPFEAEGRENVEPTADLPSEDEARRIALDFLAATGVDTATARVIVEGPYDVWHVNVQPQIDGIVVSGLAASVSVGPEGVVTSASGWLGDIEPVGDYPLIDTGAAIDRLNEQQGTQYGYDTPAIAGDSPDRAVAATEDEAPVTTLYFPCEKQDDGSEICAGTDGDPGYVDGDIGSYECSAPALGGDDIGGGTTTGVDVVEPDPGDGTTTGGTDGIVEPATDCLVPQPCYDAAPPVDDEAARTAQEGCVAPEPIPMPEPEPMEVVLTEVEPTLMLLPATDGTGDSYLVPGYRFSSSDEHVVEVAAVADDSLSPTTVPDTTVPAPAPVEPPNAPDIPSCETAVEQDPTGTNDTLVTCPPPESRP